MIIHFGLNNVETACGKPGPSLWYSKGQNRSDAIRNGVFTCWDCRIIVRGNIFSPIPLKSRAEVKGDAD